jgi:hypothetical protein
MKNGHRGGRKRSPQKTRGEKKKSCRGQALAKEHKLLRGFTAREEKKKRQQIRSSSKIVAIAAPMQMQMQTVASSRRKKS